MIADVSKLGKYPGCIGGTFPSEPKPTTCYVCGSKCTVTKQSMIGQILYGLCDKHAHYEPYMTVTTNGIGAGIGLLDPNNIPVSGNKGE